MCIPCLIYPSVASFDVTSGNKFDAQKVQEDEIFERQVVLRVISEGFNDYEYAKSPIMI